ncbi:unnamed protein product [Symbiodinium microadriaticum]|nr:unnamed protein product [Symbiodinium microadriaticum]
MLLVRAKVPKGAAPCACWWSTSSDLVVDELVALHGAQRHIADDVLSSSAARPPNAVRHSHEFVRDALGNAQAALAKARELGLAVKPRRFHNIAEIRHRLQAHGSWIDFFALKTFWRVERPSRAYFSYPVDAPVVQAKNFRDILHFDRKALDSKDAAGGSFSRQSLAGVPVAAVVQRGLFRIKEKHSEAPKSPEEVEEDDYERPASEGRRRLNLAEEFREAIALAWERALAEVELVWAQKHPVELEGLERTAAESPERGRIHQLIGMGKDDGKDCEELPEADSLDETCVGESRRVAFSFFQREQIPVDDLPDELSITMLSEQILAR